MHFNLRLGLPILTFVNLVFSEVLLDNKINETPAFLGNFLIEDSCQFQLCGSSYSREWGGEPPLAGSCSGDCSLLAITLNSNRFHKEFLWSSCARMCGNKFPADRNPEYKNRFLCMESCYSAYSLVSPHHNIARYCMKAACNPTQTEQNSFQIDCFERCTEHVSSTLPESTWKVWAQSLASTCSNQTKQQDILNSRLKCADGAVWEYISQVETKAEEKHASLCLDTLCNSQVKCGVSCLNHIHNLHKKEREEWSECSLSLECSKKSDWHARQQCADACLLHMEQEREREREMRLRSESQTQLKLQYSSPGWIPCLQISLFTASLSILVFV